MTKAMRAESSPVREAAAAWHDRLHREKVAEATREEFRQWLAASAEHRVAYDSVDQAWRQLQGLGYDPGILALRHEAALRLTRRTSSSLRPLRWAAAAVVVIALSAGLVAFLAGPIGDRSLTAWILDGIHGAYAPRYVTGTGERLAFTLSDGSQVSLDTQSELEVAFESAERTVRLTRGQAFFEVAKDPQRPFVVEARDRRFVAVGTAFDVRLDGEQVRVTMVEGTVRVEHGAPTSSTDSVSSPLAAFQRTHRASPRSSPVATIETITAGEQLLAQADRKDRVRTIDTDRSTAWRRGQVIFDNTRLADAVAELNRYSDLKIELNDPTLFDLRLSGAFATGRPTVFVEALTTYFPIQVKYTDQRSIVLGVRK